MTKKVWKTRRRTEWLTNRNKDYNTPLSPPPSHPHSSFTGMPLITDFFISMSVCLMQGLKKSVTSYKNWRKNTL